MKRFKYTAPSTLDEVSHVLKTENAVLSAGGTDLVGVLKADLLPSYPEKVVSLKNIEDLNDITEENDGLHIGAAATLTQIAESPIVRKKWQALADAAYSVASPNVRTSATIGGNICQDIRCWYYRYPHSIGGRIDCARKEGYLCSAMMGENRYHSIFGAAKVSDTPCTMKCPAGTDISAYMEFMRAGDLDKAARIVMEVNPMPAITSRVCAHFCMEGCNRNLYDESLNIGAVERYLGDYVLENHQKYMQAPAVENGKSVAIVGSGPAGLTAAYYLRQSGYSVTLYERYKEAGGCLTYAIPAYRLPNELVRKFVSALEDMGIKFVLNTNVGIDITVEQLHKENDSVMLDTGTWSRPLIGLAGEEMTEFGLDFLIDVNNYILEKPGSKVIVVGGGNVAMDVAIAAKRLGSESVRMLCLESRENMPANAEEIERALEEDVEILNGWGPKAVLTTDDAVTGIEFRRCTRVIDETGRFNPSYDESDILNLDADIVLMAIGQRADLDFLEGAYKVSTERGRIVAGPGNETSIPGIYAAGDVTTGPSTVIQAIAGGKTVAVSINKYLECEPLEVETISAARVRSDKLLFNGESVHQAEAAKQMLLPIEERAMDKEDMAGISQQDALYEAGRCFNCGCLAVNASDMANMLLAYGAVIKTNMRTLSTMELLGIKTRITDVLAKGEIVLEIIVPKMPEGAIAHYHKYRTRKSIDFAILAVGSVYVVENGVITDARISLGAVAPVPLRATEAERFLIGKEPTAENAEKAADLALTGAVALEKNAYKIEMTKTMVVDSIMAL